MHMADGLISPAVAGVMCAASAAAVVYSVKKVREEDNAKKIPLMGIMGAFVFAVQMINFTIPGTGSSGHLCGGLLLSAILGPYAGFLAMVSILIIQCLMFADGGLLALGCNIWNMAFYGCFIGYLYVYKPIVKSGTSTGKIIAGSVLGSVIGLQAGAISVVIETILSGVTNIPFAAFAALMQPIHLAIGVCEGLITAAVLTFVHNARPELLSGANAADSHISYRKTLVILASAAILAAGGLSLAASENPDGLEWSIKKLTEATEIQGDGAVYNKAAEIQDRTSVLSDYAFPESDSAAGGSVSGLLGCGAVAAVCIGGCYMFKMFRRKKGSETNA